MGLKEFSLNTAYLGKDVNNVYLKFLKDIQELNVKQVQYIIDKNPKLNFIKTRAYHKGKICLLKMPEAILKSYYVYTSLDNVKNNFVITNKNGQKHACRILDGGLYLI